MSGVGRDQSGVVDLMAALRKSVEEAKTERLHRLAERLWEQHGHPGQHCEMGTKDDPRACVLLTDDASELTERDLHMECLSHHKEGTPCPPDDASDICACGEFDSSVITDSTGQIVGTYEQFGAADDAERQAR